VSSVDEGGDLDEILSARRRGKVVNFAAAGQRPTRDEMLANSTHLLETLGFPAALAATRAQSEFLAPRDPRTTEVFNSIVNETFVPTLKRARFTKRRNVWMRRGTVENVIDIQRGHATGDLLTFTVNWAVRIPGVEEFPGRAPTAVIEGRIGDFVEQGQDRWWSIQLGWLARDMPRVSADSEQCRAELAEGLVQMVAWLDQVDTVPRLIAAIETNDRPLRRQDRGSLRETVAKLSGITDAP